MSEGIKEYLEVQSFALSLGSGISAALADKKLGVADIPLLIEPLMKAGPAIEGISNIGEELKDLSAEEKAEIVAKFNEELDIAQSEKIELMIELGHKLVWDIVAYVKMFSDLKKAE